VGSTAAHAEAHEIDANCSRPSAGIRYESVSRERIGLLGNRDERHDPLPRRMEVVAGSSSTRTRSGSPARVSAIISACSTPVPGKVERPCLAATDQRAGEYSILTATQAPPRQASADRPHLEPTGREASSLEEGLDTGGSGSGSADPPFLTRTAARKLDSIQTALPSPATPGTKDRSSIGQTAARL